MLPAGRDHRHGSSEPYLLILRLLLTGCALSTLKIINTSNKPYEFTWDGGHYGPIMPGQIVEYPEAMARHAIKRSVVLHQTGEEIGGIDYFQIEELNAVSREKVQEIAMFDCPFVASGICNAAPLKTVEDLGAHLATHKNLFKSGATVR